MLFLFTQHLLHSQAEFLVTIDPVTGIHTRINSIPGVLLIQTGPSTSTIDKQNNRYIFKGQDAAGNWRLYTVNMANAGIVYNPLFPAIISGHNNIGGFEFDDLSGQIFATGWNLSQNTVDFLSINPVTGSVTIVNTLSSVTGVGIGETTYDQNNRRYFCAGSATGTQYFTIDAATGNLLSAVTITNNLTGYPFVSRYNNVTNKLYAIISIGQPPARLVELDPATLSYTVITTLQNVSAIPSLPNYATLDEINNRYSFYMIDVNNFRNLYTVNLSTGSVISNPVFPVNLQPAENVIELRYHRSNGTLYGLHWGELQNVAAGIKSNPDALFSIYPNPFLQNTTVFLNATHQDVRLTLTTIAGQIVREENYTAVSSININKDGLPAGVYIVSLLTQTGTCTQKVIVN